MCGVCILFYNTPRLRNVVPPGGVCMGGEVGHQPCGERERGGGGGGHAPTVDAYTSIYIE